MRIANSYNGDSISSCNPIHHNKMGKVSTFRVVNNADNHRSSITGVSSQISNISAPKGTCRNTFRSHQACNISSVNPTLRRRNPLDKRSYINLIAQRIQNHTARVMSAGRHGPLVTTRRSPSLGIESSSNGFLGGAPASSPAVVVPFAPTNLDKLCPYLLASGGEPYYSNRNGS